MFGGVWIKVSTIICNHEAVKGLYTNMQRTDRADEIDYNPFYRALQVLYRKQLVFPDCWCLIQTDFKSTFLAAQRKCCLICVPQASSLPKARPFKRTFIG